MSDIEQQGDRDVIESATTDRDDPQHGPSGYTEEGDSATDAGVVDAPTEDGEREDRTVR